MATMNLSQFVVAAQTTAWDYAASTYDYSQTAYYDQTTGQYYDPTTGTYYDPQSYDYAAYYGSEYQQPASIAVPNTTGSGQQDTTNAAAAVAQAAIQQAQAAKQYQKQHETMQKQIVAQMQQQQKLAEMTPEQRLVHEAQEWSTLPGATPTSGSVAMVSAQPVQPTQHVATSATEYPKYPIPDVSSYQYDEASGYYYDPVTSLYYDANSQYYYNSTTGQFMYWDGEQQTYLPAPTESQETTGDNQNPEQKKGKEKDKKEKVKVAKKIAKDMEKWAKTLNAQKEAMKEGFKKSFQPLAGGGEGGGVGGSSGGGGGHGYKESASADAGFAILEKRAVMDRKAVIDVFKKDEPKSLMPPPVMPGKSNEAIPGLVASYGGDSDEDEEDDGGMDPTDETKHVDLNKMACLLCKRQFPNKDALTRHTQLSDLHRKNLEDLHKRQAAAQAAGISIQYRDRAKERRQKYGIPTPPTPKKKAAQFEAPEPYEQPTKEGIGHENIGNKLLQKMGWSKGQGLGKANQGIVDPIQAMHRQQQAGLGARGSSYQVNPADSYKETVKKVMFARYQELQ